MREIEYAIAILGETIKRLETLISRGDLSSDTADEKTTRSWLYRVRKARRGLKRFKIQYSKVI